MLNTGVVAVLIEEQKEQLVPSKLTETMDHKGLKLQLGTHAGGRENLTSWCQPEEECVAQDERSHDSDNLSDHLKGQAGTEVITDRITSWPGPLPLPVYLNPNLPEVPQRRTWGSLVPFICSPFQCHSQ